jgi:hypothetical protein
VLQLAWDGSALGPPAEVFSAEMGKPGFRSAISVPWGDVWLSWALDGGSSHCAAGRHELSATVIKRHPQLSVPITLTDVEVVVRYPANEVHPCRL